MLASLATAFGGKRVLVTGHTGFKGSWLTLWLARLGARVTGYALAPATTPALFDVLGLAELCSDHHIADVRDGARLRAVLRAAAPEVVFHLAAQSLVRASYADPLTTFETNAMGTAQLLEGLRAEGLAASVVVVSTDKCYENREWPFGYREDDVLGGHDPYAASKAAAELVVASFRRSFFRPERLREHGVALASARAGNVIGGGDWAADRIVVDAVVALAEGRPIAVRNPASVRPWQHVLEPLGGYLELGARLGAGTPEERARFCQAWNFGPSVESTREVRHLVDRLIAAWGGGRWEHRPEPGAPHEGALLRLSIDKAFALLGWRPRWPFEEAVARTVAWYRAFYGGASRGELRALAEAQLDAYADAGR